MASPGVTEKENVRTTLARRTNHSGAYRADRNALPSFGHRNAQAIFHKQANGSLIEVNGKVIGSELIGQKFTKPEYFQGRPSAAGDGYDAANSGASNFGPTNQKLVDRIKADAEKFRKENPDFTSRPADLLTASAALDPHLSPASAAAQASRMAKARGGPFAQIRIS